MLMRRKLASVVLLAAFGASFGHAQILNSQRIEQTFGSYGIEVLYSDDALRVSSLYSEDHGRRVTRTAAIVAYPVRVPRALASEHETILRGGSIGATLQAAGWEVSKSSHSYFTSSAADLATLMDVDEKTPLATHGYRLSVSQAGVSYDYAWIIETHHPDYLRERDLVEIYGPEPTGGASADREREVRALWDRGRRQLAESALGQ